MTLDGRSSGALGYRPDIDGLRAIAVAIVVIFHAFPGWLPEGFMGVDVFFVISGFLISSIILREAEKDEFSLLGFYGRRARRIAPALVVVVVSVWTAGRFFLLADQFKSLGREISASAAFLSNFLFWSQSNYFDRASEAKPLLHLWSLAVEEQFYLLWPPLVLLLLGKGMKWRRLRIGSGLLFLGSLAYAIFRGPHDPVETFFLLPARFWELLAGCCLAELVQSRRHAEIPEYARRAMGVFSLVPLIAALLLADSRKPWPGPAALLPILSSLMFIAAGPDGVMNRLFSGRFFVALGVVSYPLYLWHWPILAILHSMHPGEKLDPFVCAAAVSAATALSFATWKFIELPVQRRWFSHLNERQRSQMFVLLAAGTVAFLWALGAAASSGYAFTLEQRSMSCLADYREYRPDWQDGKCFLGSPAVGFAAFSDQCTASSSGDRNVFLWGDSHAAQLYPGMHALLSRDRVSLLQLTASQCPPLLEYSDASRPHCREINQFVFRQLGRIKPDVLVMSADWSVAGGLPSFGAQMRQTLRSIRGLGIRRVIVVGPVPRWKYAFPQIMERRFLLQGQTIPERTSVDLQPGLAELDAKIEAAASAEDAVYLSPAKLMCDSAGCITSVGANRETDLISFDQAHVTNPGSVYLADRLLHPALSKLLLNRGTPIK